MSSSVTLERALAGHRARAKCDVGTLPAVRSAGRRAHGRSARRRPSTWAVGQPLLHGGPVRLRPLGRHLFNRATLGIYYMLYCPMSVCALLHVEVLSKQLLPPGLPPRTFAWTISSSYSVFDFIFSLFFVSGPCARFVSFWAHVDVPHRIVSYATR